MSWHPDRIQTMLLLAISIAVIVTIVSISRDRSLITFTISGRAGLLLLGVLLIYTGYDNQRKPSETKNLLFRGIPLIGSGLLLILFVIVVTITSLFHFG